MDIAISNTFECLLQKKISYMASRLFITKLGRIADKIRKLLYLYKNQEINALIGEGERSISYPYSIVGVENIIMDSPVSIGENATIYTTRAKLIIKQHFVAGPGLTIITGDHMSIPCKFLDEVTDADKDKYDTKHECDQDVIIEEDVWCGANVTILKGVTIGRGCIIAAGALVIKDIPPYSIAGGVPARVIKQRMNEQEILIHESHLYPEHLRIKSMIK